MCTVHSAIKQNGRVKQSRQSRVVDNESEGMKVERDVLVVTDKSKVVLVAFPMLRVPSVWILTHAHL